MDCIKLNLNKELFEKINLRPADFSDRDILLEWRNNIKVREKSFNSQIISKEEHEKWFNEVLKSEYVILLIGLLGKKRIGQIRFNINEKIAKISVNVSPDIIGKGFGPILIIKGSKFLFENTNCEEIIAEIKSDNIASIKAFSKSGFTEIASDGNKISMRATKKDFFNLIAKLEQ
ncbi:MAG: hypothetical protein CVT88_00155 [Candidatus Altiarchaeales archaeon HGW-Altiarchaeales-1]|nr:MAG: hypothetical protein CVT88_00155 [Candidatus Altiarchaeales archaeon HGW-Altiarchaeales-1]